MSQFFVDSSALVKRYVTEVGTPWIQALSDPVAGNTLVSAASTRVEVAAALASRHQASAGLSLAERDGAVALLEQHCATEYVLIPIDTPALDRALTLTQRHRLRGYDAVQLATALAVNVLVPRSRVASAYLPQCRPRSAQCRPCRGTHRR
ncbi:MAG: type II toxin-antitoxin system VapC family toxin [Blastochloris sp.]|nr:type II toxin-antitoxin system VapC family toxin [Blastochloris sp.]